MSGSVMILLIFALIALVSGGVDRPAPVCVRYEVDG